MKPVCDVVLTEGVLKVKYRLAGRKRLGGGKRGKVGNLSRSSGLRLREKVLGLDISRPGEILEKPWFVTLTFPVEMGVTFQGAKKFLRKLGKRMKRRWAESGFVWRIEPHKSLRPHFHLIVWGIPGSVDLRKWMSLHWFQVCGSGLEKHFRAGTECSQIRSYKGVVHYVSKYVSKTSEHDIYMQVGRLWGMEGKKPGRKVIMSIAPKYFFPHLLEWAFERGIDADVVYFSRIFRSGIFDDLVGLVKRCMAIEVLERVEHG